MAENESFGYMNKTLRINLTSRDISVEDYSDLYDDLLGGSGLAAKILYDELKDWHTPYDPMNKMIFSSGALIGTVAPGACKMSVSSLSPVTGGWGTGSSDSHVGVQLKQAGYDNIIVEGRSHFPCYLWITNDTVEIRDASHLWGKTTFETLDALREELGDPSLHVLSIGPAGENLSRNACILQDTNRAFGRCGSGAVMGSKNLKAIVCKGNKSVRIAEPKRFYEKALEVRRRIHNTKSAETLGKYGTTCAFEHKQDICGLPYKNFQECRIPDDVAENLNPMDIIDKYQVGRQGFPGCAIACGRQMHVTDGPYAGLKTNMNQWEVVGSIIGKMGVKEPTFMLMANHRCNELGIDVDVAGGAIAWAMECYQRGIITEEDTGGIAIEWGDEEVILELIEMMSYRRGFGNILAEGSWRAADIIGRGSDYYSMHVKKQDLYELTRSSMAWCLGTATSTRGGGHTTGTPNCEQSGLPIDDEMSMKVMGVTGDVAMNMGGYEGKAKMVFYHEILHRVCNSVGVCLFNTIHMDMNFVNIDDLVELLTAATGRDFSKERLEEITMRQLNIEKALNLRFTNFARKDDFPPQREMEEPISTGSRKGFKIDKEKYNQMLDEYYQMHRWNEETSYPTRDAYQKYGLDYVARDMERIGKLGKA
jgi:aldehyde:ferredoxin oxidoreductase